MKEIIKFSEEEMKNYLPIIQKLETPDRLGVKLTREISGLLVTLDGEENEIEAYLESCRQKGIDI